MMGKCSPPFFPFCISPFPLPFELAFFRHTFLELVDWHYQQLRQALGARRTFFENSRSLMQWHLFESWEALIAFMCDGLELGASP